MSNNNLVVILVARCFIRRADGRFLLLKRADTDTYLPGAWECPGGKLEKGQDVLEAMKAETWQETGIEVAVEHAVVYVVALHPTTEFHAGKTYVCMFGIGSCSKETTVTLSDEHSAYAWATEKEALSYNLRPDVLEALLYLKTLDKKSFPAN